MTLEAVVAVVSAATAMACIGFNVGLYRAYSAVRRADAASRRELLFIRTIFTVRGCWLAHVDTYRDAPTSAFSDGMEEIDAEARRLHAFPAGDKRSEEYDLFGAHGARARWLRARREVPGGGSPGDEAARILCQHLQDVEQG